MGTRTQLGPWVFLGARACASLRRMSFRQILPLAVLVTALMPASALAATTVTVTGDDGNPVAAERGRARDASATWTSTADVNVPTTDTPYYTSQVLDPAGAPASSLSPAATTRYSPTAKNFTDYRGNGTYSVVLRYFNGRGTPTATAPRPRRALPVTRSTPASRVATPPGRALTRAPNAFITNTYQLGVALNPGASTYEVRYALGGVAGPRRRDLRPLGRDVRRPHHRARGLPLRQAGPLADRRARQVGQLLHAVERAGERQRDRAVRPRAHLVPRRPRAELQGARPGP